MKLSMLDSSPSLPSTRKPRTSPRFLVISDVQNIISTYMNNLDNVGLDQSTRDAVGLVLTNLSDKVAELANGRPKAPKGKVGRPRKEDTEETKGVHFVGQRVDGTLEYFTRGDERTNQFARAYVFRTEAGAMYAVSHPDTLKDRKSV